MSDEPVRGAPSIDAFWVVKVENDVRHPPVSPHSLSFFLSFARFLSCMLFRLKRIRRRHTRLGGRFNLRACHPGESMICQWFSWVKDYHLVVRFICKSRELTAVISKEERHLLQIWPRLIIRRKMCTASTKYWVMTKMEVR